jgi:hypothetical protein
MFKRLLRAWKIAKSELTVEDLEAIDNKRGNGKGEFLGGFMTEHEIAQDIKENELGWKALYDKIRNL